MLEKAKCKTCDESKDFQLLAQALALSIYEEDVEYFKDCDDEKTDAYDYIFEWTKYLLQKSSVDAVVYGDCVKVIEQISKGRYSRFFRVVSSLLLNGK